MRNKYRMIAADIDGTLLNSRGEITEKVKKSICKAVEKGVVFTISTGRPIQGVERITKEIGLDIPVITYNGAMVITGKTRKIIYEKLLDENDARRVIDIGQNFGTTVIVWSQNRLYVNHMNEKTEKYSALSGVKPEKLQDADEVCKVGVAKVLWYDEVSVINKYKEEVGKLLTDNINYHTSQPFFLEFVDKNASKAIALEKMREHYGIKREEIIAVGDGFNDLSMILYAGLGVAMENADDEIKKKADFVTKSNDKNGLAYVIDKFILTNN